MLYNKYRPQKIGELFGQGRAQDLLYYVNKDDYSHTLIFHGASGTGKTTAARLFKKKLHCKNIIDNEVCNDCSGCNDFTTSYFEIDAAENSGVDDIRSLKQQSKRRTLDGSTRIFYIDEIQNLSKKAFDALLKVTEEPGNNVFILSTTELNKIPDTIQTRSMKILFKSPDLDELKVFILDILEKEGYNVDDDVAGVMAFTAGESYREAITNIEILVQAFPNKKSGITTDDLNNKKLFLSKKEINAIKQFPSLYKKRDWAAILKLLKNMEASDQAYRSLSYYMYGVAYNTGLSRIGKSITKEELAFLTKISSLLSQQIRITRYALENIIWEVIKGY